MMQTPVFSRTMDPSDTAAGYDRIACWWQKEHQQSSYGISHLQQAIQFTAQRTFALDVGCGSSGRFMTLLAQQGFEVEGLDISAEMIRLAQHRHPNWTFYQEDICRWIPPKQYSFLSAWDSTFHLPLSQQEPVLRKLCAALEPNGVLLFTCGGGNKPGEIKGGFQGQVFEYSTLGVDAVLRILSDQGCTCRHLEYDQYPENHVVIIAQKE